MLKYDIRLNDNKESIIDVDSLDTGEIAIVTSVPNNWSVRLGDIVIKSSTGWAILGKEICCGNKSGDKSPGFKCRRLNKNDSITIKLHS